MLARQKILLLGLGMLLLFLWIYPFADEQLAYNLYIPNAADGTVSVINSERGEVDMTLKVGETASHGVAVTRDNRYLFAGDLDGSNIYVFATEDNRLVETIEVGTRTHGIDISPDGRYVLVTSGRGGGPYLAVISTQSLEIVAVIEDDLVGPTHISFSPDAKRAYVSDPGQDGVVLVDLVNMESAAVWPTGAKGAQESRTSPDGSRLYVANYEGGSVTVLDTADGEILDIVEAGELTHAVAVSPDGRYVWVAVSGSGEVIVFDAGVGMEIVKTLSYGRPNHLAFQPDGARIYITDTMDDRLLVVDPESYEIVNEIAVGRSPHEIDFVVAP